MIEVNNSFLKTGQSQASVTKVLIERIKPSVEYLTYKIKRYHVPMTLVLFYSEIDIFAELSQSIRLTDIIDIIKIGDSYFSFIFLTFTEEVDSYEFIKHIERTKLADIEHYYYYKTLEPIVNNYYNFINAYLFEIEEKRKNT